jgi:ATP-dependent exoDNAse (exonuclease V) beta subunit
MAAFDEEELNLWYVGCTRAVKFLHIALCAEVEAQTNDTRPPRATTVPRELLQYLNNHQ